LAGVVVPTIALAAIAAIPYFDRSPLGVGILGTSAKGRKIAGFSALWTTVVISIYIVADEFVGGERTGWGIGNWLEERTGSVEIAKILYPSIVMLISIAMLVGAVQAIFRPTRREMIIALFTGFFVAYWVLSAFGTSFRGPGQHLMWPWDLPLTHH
jgi:hypothetical protein